MKNTTNPLDYPRYVRGIPPVLPESFSQYTIEELEKLQDSMDNMAVAASEHAQALVDEERIARVTEDEALAAQILTIRADVDDNRALIEDEAVARATADSALASRTTTLETTVGGHTASISTMQSSIDGLSLKYSVTLDSNGYITGFEQNNNGNFGQFIVRADVFKVVSPGQTAQTMFQVDANGVHFTGKHTITGLTTGTLNADMQMGTGRIIWDNGTFMKVAGVGFGTSNQFIEWFGPKMPINQCSESNAITYLKTNGDAYFGGSLRVGTLRNAGQTTSTSTTAEIVLEPFNSNGKSRTVTLSYAFNQSGVRISNGTVSGTFNVGTVALYRSLNEGVSWTQIATLNVTSENFNMVHRTGVLTGTGSFSATSAEPAQYTMSASQSLTYTDSALTTGKVMYRAVLSGRSVYTVGGTAQGADTTTQSISIISVEE